MELAACAALFGALAGGMLARGDTAIVDFARNSWELSSAGADGAALQAVLLVLRLSVSFAAATALSAFVWGIVQSGWLFVPHLLAPTASRLIQPQRLLHGSWNRCGEFLGRLALVAATGGSIWILSSESLFQTNLGALGGDRTQQFTALAAQPLLVLLGCAFFGGILSRFIAGLRFRARHAMSRTEFEAEAREGELPAELRRTLLERHE